MIEVSIPDTDLALGDEPITDIIAKCMIDLESNLNSAHRAFVALSIPCGEYISIAFRYSSLLSALQKEGYTEKHPSFGFPVKPNNIKAKKQPEATTATVDVPVEELKKLEQARVQLYEFLTPYLDEKQMLVLSNITGQLWKVANTKNWEKCEPQVGSSEFDGAEAFEEYLEIHANCDDSEYPTPVPRVVVCAAIKLVATEDVGVVHNGDIVVGSRHYDTTMHNTLDALPQDRVAGKWEQGFIDQNGVFMTRQEAWRVASCAGQIIRRVGGDAKDGGTLYSENLY